MARSLLNIFLRYFGGVMPFKYFFCVVCVIVLVLVVLLVCVVVARTECVEPGGRLAGQSFCP